MRAYPYRLCGDSVTAKSAESAGHILNAWCREWFVEPLPAHTLRMTSDFSPGAATWRLLKFDQDLWVACRLKDRAERDFMQLLFGSSAGAAHSPILADVFDSCIRDMLQRLLQPASLDEIDDAITVANLDGLRANAGSGVLFASVEGALPFSGLAFGGAWVESVASDALPLPAAQPVPLLPRRSALGTGEIHVELSLGEAELTLAELAGISVGDVLALDVPHQAPLQLRGADGTPLCKVHLGRTGQHIAVQVFSK